MPILVGKESRVDRQGVEGEGASQVGLVCPDLFFFVLCVCPFLCFFSLFFFQGFSRSVRFLFLDYLKDLHGTSLSVQTESGPRPDKKVKPPGLAI